MELRKDYEAIRREACSFAMDGVDPFTTDEVRDAIQNAVERCQALADRPPRELSDAEIEKCFLREYGLGITVTKRDIAAGRIVIEAHIAKQKEPETERLDLAKLATGEWELLFRGNPCDNLSVYGLVNYPADYTMRRKS